MNNVWNRLSSVGSLDWRDRSACRQLDAAIFFPVGSTRYAVRQTQSAKSVCARCEVREECLDFALKANQELGVWGGTSEEERRRLRRQWLAARRAARS